MSGANISSGTIADSALATTTFVKTGTAPTLTGTNFTYIPTSAITSGALTVTTLTCSSEVNSGNLKANSICEALNACTTNRIITRLTIVLDPFNIYQQHQRPVSPLNCIIVLPVQRKQVCLH